MSDLVSEKGMGFELIERFYHVVAYEQLNDEIDIWQDAYSDLDEEFNLTVGNEDIYVSLDHIEPDNFYSGERPSLIETPPREKFPNFSVMAFTGSPPNTDVIDQTQNWDIEVGIEIMVNSDISPKDAARKRTRTAEAVNQVMMRNQYINGFTRGFRNDPTVDLVDIFKRSENTSHGNDWWWTGAVLRYNMIRHANYA